MKTETISITSILVLSFAVFIAGFLAGMLAVAMISVPTDPTSMGFMFFALGLAVGAAGASLALIILKKRRIEKV